MKNLKKNIYIYWVLISIFVCPIFGQNKNVNTLSINSLENISIGGVKQWILLRGAKTSNPILLFLHGGPGFPEIPFTPIDSQKLEEHFIVVNWDQRGAGKSYDPTIPEESLNQKQILSDTYDLIQILRKRFSRDKIFLLGHSWGSILGLRIAHKFPKFLHAYIGMGQVINMQEGELISYQYTVKMAKESKNENDMKLLEKIGPPSKWKGNQSRFIQRQLLAKYKGTFKNVSYGDIGKYMNTNPYYTEKEKSNTMRGFFYIQKIMMEKIMKVNMFDEISELKVPVYFFIGKYDYQTPYKLIEQYFKILKAPFKKIIWFKNSGHYPNLDEPDLYQDRLINLVLKNTNLNKEKINE